MIKNLITKNISYICILIIGIGSIFLNFSHHRWQKDDSVIEWDVKSYYAYLPATFIYKDLSLQFRRDNIDKFGDLIWPVETPTHKHAIVTTMGLSFLYSPFFGIAHIYSLVSDYEADGYSLPYRFALVFSSLFYVILGLIFLQKTLREFFREDVVALVVTAIGIGTNLFYYYTYEAAMPHAYNFTLISLFLYLTIRFYKNPGIKKIFWLGLISGLITLIRPTNIIVLLLFFLWNISSVKDLKNRIIWFVKEYKIILVMLAAFILIWIPQFVYWYWISGKIFYFSYGEIGGKFFFSNPQLKNILISYKKGWFVYTPLMLIAFAGIFTLPKQQKGLFLPILSFTLINIYVLASWWCWWFGGSFGLRAFIDSYAIMAIPLAAIISRFSIKKYLKLISFGFISILIIFNIFQIQQYTNQAIHYWWMNKTAYWETFLKLRPTERYWQVITLPDYDKAREGIYVEIKPEYQKKENNIIPSEEKLLMLISNNIRNDSVHLSALTIKAKETETHIDSLVKTEAKKIYLADSTEYKKELIIQNLIISLKNNSELMEKIEKKAKKRDISLDSMLVLDAIWLYENNKY
ncbi:MAG: hypothetical protein KOO66_04865 [Bacteroidales bacterium]|nr:hypothetical protein [Bacteroidales bacterium]